MIMLEVVFMSDNTSKLKNFMREISSYTMLVMGAVIAAFSIEEFLVPCTILDPFFSM